MPVAPATTPVAATSPTLSFEALSPDQSATQVVPVIPIQFNAAQSERGCGSCASDIETSMVAPSMTQAPKTWDDPLQEWTEAELLAEIERRGLRIPVSWLHFNSSGTYCVVERPPRNTQTDVPPSPHLGTVSPTLGGG